MKNPNNIVYIRHQAPLTQTISTEAWLHKMAQDGLLLESVQGSKYKFKKGAPADIYYFMMTPETGTNSDSWVFYEFEQKMGKQIPCNGLSLFSPSLMLMAGREEVDRQSELISYYFCYRNYRLLRRFKRNGIGFSIFFILSTFVCLCHIPEHFIALFPYLVASGLLCFHSIYSYFHFRSACRAQGVLDPSRKPTRPGY